MVVSGQCLPARPGPSVGMGCQWGGVGKRAGVAEPRAAAAAASLNRVAVHKWLVHARVAEGRGHVMAEGAFSGVRELTAGAGGSTGSCMHGWVPAAGGKHPWSVDGAFSGAREGERRFSAEPTGKGEAGQGVGEAAAQQQPGREQ